MKHRLILGVDRQSCHHTQPGGKPKAVAGQHAGSFPRVYSEGAATPPSPVPPGPPPRLGRCLSASPGGRELLSQAAAGALSSFWAVFLPQPLLLLSLLCSSGFFPALKVVDPAAVGRAAARRPGGPRFRREPPRSRLPLCLPTPGAGAAGPGSHGRLSQQPPPDKADETGRRAGIRGPFAHPHPAPAFGGRRAPKGARPGPAAAPPEADPRSPLSGPWLGAPRGGSGAAPAAAGRAGVSSGGGRCPRCPMAARARA